MCPELTRDTIPRTRDVGHFLSVTGTVIRTSIAKVTAFHICTCAIQLNGMLLPTLQKT